MHLLAGSVKCPLPGLNSTLGIVVKLSINTIVLWFRATGSKPIFGGGKQHTVRVSALSLSH